MTCVKRWLLVDPWYFLRGQCPQNLHDARNIDSHDPVDQTHKVMQNIVQLIGEAGGTIEDLVKIVVYITDVRHREAVYRTMGEYIKDVYPVSTGLVVQALARPEWLGKLMPRLSYQINADYCQTPGVFCCHWRVWQYQAGIDRNQYFRNHPYHRRLRI